MTRIAIWPTDPGLRMRIAKRLISRLHGVEEDRIQNVESSLDANGELTVVADVTVSGTVAYVSCDVKIDWDGKP